MSTLIVLYFIKYIYFWRWRHARDGQKFIITLCLNSLVFLNTFLETLKHTIVYSADFLLDVDFKLFKIHENVGIGVWEIVQFYIWQ